MPVILVAREVYIEGSQSRPIGQKVRPYPKNNQAKKAGGMVQVIECLPCKHEALNSNSNSAKTFDELKE
jgi:hypothetical protein